MSGHLSKSAICVALWTLAVISRLPVAYSDDAPANPPGSAKSEVRRPAAASNIERFESVVNGLKLTDDQKLKTKILFDAADEQIKKLDGKRDPNAAAQKSTAIYDKLRKDVGEILTNEQKIELIKKMRPSASAIIEKIKAQLASPEAKLTDEQRKRAFEVLDDTKQKLEAIRDQAKPGAGTETADRMNAVLKEMREKLSKVLGPGEPAAK